MTKPYVNGYEKRGSVEYSPLSPDLTSLNFYLLESLKAVVQCREPLALKMLQEQSENNNHVAPSLHKNWY
jgi:hypothetical protein